MIKSTLKGFMNTKPTLQRLWVEENDEHFKEPTGMGLNIQQQDFNK